jgi:hypothetical protein
MNSWSNSQLAIRSMLDAIRKDYESEPNKLSRVTAHHAKLATDPYFEAEGIVRCDCLLLNEDGSEPPNGPALIQLISGPRTRHRGLPAWKAGDVLTLTPGMNLAWNDVQETGRCFVDLAIVVTCKGREGFLAGMVPVNPDLHDFSKDAVRA